MNEQEFRIHEVARLAGTTVRNVRSYQDRGLLPPPRKQGRVAMYSEIHLCRLTLIGHMLNRGYRLTNIAELIAAWQAGDELGDVLGVKPALVAVHGDSAQ